MVHKLPREGITHVVGLYDIHFPYENKAALRAVYDYIVDTNPQVIILGGDVVDLDMLHNKASARGVEGKRLKKDFDYAYGWLAELRRRSPESTIYFLEGNHDERIERYIDDHPEVEGMLEIKNALRLDELNIRWVPSWRVGEILTIGKANFIHGQYLNKHHAATTVDNYGCNIMYGHIHDISSNSKVLHGDDSTLIAQSCGCLCRYDMPYLQGRPTKWQNAFLDMYIRPNGFFNHQVVSIFKGKFVVNGVEYGY
jgi:hypothetical protein